MACTLLLLGLFFAETIDMSQWQAPVYHATWARQDGVRLFLVEDKTVMVFDVSNGYRQPQFLWQTPGVGQGPGQLPSSAYLNQIAIDPESKDLWISYTNGFKVFNQEGLFQKDVGYDLPNVRNQSHIYIHGKMLFMSTLEAISDRVYLRAFDKDELLFKDPEWELRHPGGLPITDGGPYLEPTPELFRIQGYFYIWDPSTGEFLKINANGGLETFEFLPQAVFHPNNRPVHFDGKPLVREGHYSYRVRSYELPQSGLIGEGDFLWTSLFRPSKPWPMRVLVKLTSNGKVLEAYTHPILTKSNDITRHYLFALRNDNFYFLDLNETDKLHLIPRRELKTHLEKR